MDVRDIGDIGIGYTLATGRLFCDFAAFQAWSERLLGRPVYTHEFASEDLWTNLRQAFESLMSEGRA